MNDITNNFISFGRQAWTGAKLIRNFSLSSIRKVFLLMGKKEKIIFWALISVALISFIWSIRNFYLSHTMPAPGLGGSYTEGFLGQPNYINPALAYQDNDQAIIKLVYSGLYKYDNLGNLMPDLAEGMPQISEDQKQYTIALKKNIQWHNGKPFKADDVVFTMLTIKDPAFKSPLRSAWASTNVEKIDDLTVKFTTKEVTGPFLNNLTLGILPQNIWSKTQAQNFALSENNLKAVGTGPYAIKEIKKNASGKIQSIALESFSNYYAGKANIDSITIKFFNTGEDLINALHSGRIQGFGYVPFDQKLYLDAGRKDANILRLALPRFQVVFFNYLNKNLAEQHVRLALAKLINRDAIIEKAWNNNTQKTASLFDFYLNGSDNQTNGQDLEGAANLLKAAGWKKDAQGQWIKNNKPLTLRLFTNDSLPNAKTAEILVQTWRDFGIDVSLNIVNNKDLMENRIKTRDFDILIFGQKFGADPDPFAFWHSSQTKYPGLNLGGFEDPQADQLMTAAHTTTDKNLRQQKYQQLEALLKDRAPVVFLAQNIYIYAFDKNIKGVSISKLFEPSNRFYDTPNWYIQESRVWK